MSNEPPTFIKTPLNESINWNDVPPDLKGRVILKRWPGDETTAAGLVIPEGGNRRVMGVAWVYRASGDAKKVFFPGDSVIIPETTLQAGLFFPSDNGELDDYREVHAEDIYHVLPAADARKWYDKACSEAIDAAFEAIPQIEALADGGDCTSAASWATRLMGKKHLYDQVTIDAIEACSNRVLKTAKVQAIQREVDKKAAEKAAKDKMASERQAMLNRKNNQSREKRNVPKKKTQN